MGDDWYQIHRSSRLLPPILDHIAVLRTSYVDVAYCYKQGSVICLLVSLSVNRMSVCHCCEPCVLYACVGL